MAKTGTNNGPTQHSRPAPPQLPLQSNTQATKDELASRKRAIRKTLLALLDEELMDIKAQEEELTHGKPAAVEFSRRDIRELARTAVRPERLVPVQLVKSDP
ncbi:MAG: hypothetical protein L6R40_002610 [Gallowayella cf. fulva]|nr:MAG: hypothetical protein L6R40_002610 [Xanthomendoza cf. fulva]